MGRCCVACVEPHVEVLMAISPEQFRRGYVTQPVHNRDHLQFMTRLTPLL